MNPIHSISQSPGLSVTQGIGQPSGVSPGGSQGVNAESSKEGSFKNMLVDSINQVNTMQQDADKLVEQLVTGGDVNAAEVLTAVQKADLSFRMMMQVRNKAMQAFQEVRNIRI